MTFQIKERQMQLQPSRPKKNHFILKMPTLHSPPPPPHVGFWLLGFKRFGTNWSRGLVNPNLLFLSTENALPSGSSLPACCSGFAGVSCPLRQQRVRTMPIYFHQPGRWFLQLKKFIDVSAGPQCWDTLQLSSLHCFI